MRLTTEAASLIGGRWTHRCIPRRAAAPEVPQYRTPGEADRRPRHRTGEADRRPRYRTGEADRRPRYRTPGEADRRPRYRTGEADRQLPAESGSAARPQLPTISRYQRRKRALAGARQSPPVADQPPRRRRAPPGRTALLYGPGLSGRPTARAGRYFHRVLISATGRAVIAPSGRAAAGPHCTKSFCLRWRRRPRRQRRTVAVRGAPLSRASRRRGAASTKTGQLMIIWRTATAPQVFTPVLACFCARCESSRD